jgi:DNA polymerase-3 subunit chi
MPEISFYLLSTTGAGARYAFACKLIEKAYRSGYFAYVVTDSDSQSQWLDQLLWTFRPTSFVPHEIYHGSLPEFANTVLIGSLPAPEAWQKLIINLATPAVIDLSKTERVLEILDNDESIKQAGRQRYRYYQQLGLKLQTHQIT